MVVEVEHGAIGVIHVPIDGLGRAGRSRVGRSKPDLVACKYLLLAGVARVAVLVDQLFGEIADQA